MMILTVHVDGREWRQTASLADAGPEETVFSVDAQGGVTFGDGRTGKRPPEGASVTIEGRTGAGASGNVRVSVSTFWPPSASGYLVALSPEGIRIGGDRRTAVQTFATKRPNYFSGKLMDADDFNREQEYLIGGRRRHNRALHGPGIVSGLGVSVGSDTAGASVKVEPGFALDGYGREIELLTPICVPLDTSSRMVIVVLDYAERPTDFVPGPGGSTEIVPSSIEEGASVRVRDADTDETEGIVIARAVLESEGWVVDRSFLPVRCHQHS